MKPNSVYISDIIRNVEYWSLMLVIEKKVLYIKNERSAITLGEVSYNQ